MKILTQLQHFLSIKLVIITLILLSLTGGGFFFYSNANKKAPLEYATVERKSISQTVSAAGSLQGKDSADLRFKISGRLAYLNVKSGDLVVKGQVIGGLDTQDLSIALQQAQNSYRAAEANAEKIEDDVKDNSDDENFTQKNTRTQAQAARDSAFDDIKKTQRAFQDAVLISPFAGVITKASIHPGQFVSAADTIAQVVNNSEYFFDAEVDESDLGKVGIDQVAQITLDAYPSQTFHGIVEEILPLTETTSSGSTIVKVRIKLDSGTINFVSGLSGQAEIIINQSNNALSIPQEALEEENIVYVERNNKIEKINVEVGLSSDTEIEIKNGLNEGEKVVTNPQAIKNK